MTWATEQRPTPPVSRGSSARGLTLVEVLVASVLLGIGVAGLTWSAAAGMRNQQRSHRRTAALYLAQEKLAEVTVLGPRMWLLTEQTQGHETQGELALDWSLRIESQTEGELYDVSVRVGWSHGADRGNVELETLLNDFKAAGTPGLEDGERKSPLETSGEPTG